jgi:hypothetical protein
LVWAVALVRAQRAEKAGRAVNRGDERAAVLVFSHED